MVSFTPTVTADVSGLVWVNGANTSAEKRERLRIFLGPAVIEAVNILGSLFYGVILGVFLVAFWIKYVKSNAVFIAALVTELMVIAIYKMEIISFLWLNVIGAVFVIVLSLILQPFFRNNK